MLRAQPEQFGPGASDPVVSRLVTRLAEDARQAPSAARQRAWDLAGDAAPGVGGGLVTVDTDAMIVASCSEKTGHAHVEEYLQPSPADRLR